MQICPECGEENPAKFRLCGFCGTPLGPALPPREVRKTVTIVFSDLKGSTAMAERLDSESLREVMTRYFDSMRTILEQHGGRVEKYIGDAIMAVFGLPRLHEDDALRAVRAAAEMRDELHRLNDRLEEVWGVRLTTRTGVNTGEVVTGDPATGQRLVIGDPVNVAARLEQAAPAMEVLIGDPTYRLVRDAVTVDEVDPMPLKGKSEPVPAYRLIAVSDGEGVARRLDSPLVGRAEELGVLEDAYASAVAGPRLRADGGARGRRARQDADHDGARQAPRRRGAGRPRPLSSLRAGHHVLAARRGRARGGRDRGRRRPAHGPSQAVGRARRSDRSGPCRVRSRPVR